MNESAILELAVEPEYEREHALRNEQFVICEAS